MYVLRRSPGQNHHREAELWTVKQSSKPGEHTVEEGHQGYEDHEVDDNGYDKAHGRSCTLRCCLKHIGVALSEETCVTVCRSYTLSPLWHVSADDELLLAYFDAAFVFDMRGLSFGPEGLGDGQGSWSGHDC